MAKNKLTGGQVGALSDDIAKKINHNFVDVGVLAADFTANSSGTGATLTNLAGLSTDTLIAGEKYYFEAILQVNNTTNGGLTIAHALLNGLTLTEISYSVEAKASTTMAQSRGTTTTTGTKMFDSAAAAQVEVTINGHFVVGVAGNWQLQAAQHTSHADTTTVYKGSRLRVWHLATN